MNPSSLKFLFNIKYWINLMVFLHHAIVNVLIFHLYLQSETPSSYMLAVDFIKAASSHLEPYIQLVWQSYLEKLMLFVSRSK